MADPAINPTGAAGDALVATAPRSVVPARCLRCAADLSRLSEAGRYCPRCGLDTYGSPPAALFEQVRESALPTPFLDADWRHLAELSPGDKANPPPVAIAALPSPETSSEILRGYSNALYRLGRRYELGGGPARNRREAFRCYRKAARLGNFMAFARLATRWLEGQDSPASAVCNDATDSANVTDSPNTTNPPNATDATVH